MTAWHSIHNITCPFINTLVHALLSPHTRCNVLTLLACWTRWRETKLSLCGYRWYGAWSLQCLLAAQRRQSRHGCSMTSYNSHGRTAVPYVLNVKLDCVVSTSSERCFDASNHSAACFRISSLSTSWLSADRLAGPVISAMANIKPANSRHGCAHGPPWIPAYKVNVLPSDSSKVPGKLSQRYHIAAISSDGVGLYTLCHEKTSRL